MLGWRLYDGLFRDGLRRRFRNEWGDEGEYVGEGAKVGDGNGDKAGLILELSNDDWPEEPE